MMFKYIREFKSTCNLQLLIVLILIVARTRNIYFGIIVSVLNNKIRIDRILCIKIKHKLSLLVPLTFLFFARHWVYYQKNPSIEWNNVLNASSCI